MKTSFHIDVQFSRAGGRGQLAGTVTLACALFGACQSGPDPSANATTPSSEQRALIETPNGYRPTPINIAELPILLDGTALLEGNDAEAARQDDTLSFIFESHGQYALAFTDPLEAAEAAEALLGVPMRSRVEVALPQTAQGGNAADQRTGTRERAVRVDPSHRTRGVTRTDARTTHQRPTALRPAKERRDETTGEFYEHVDYGGDCVLVTTIDRADLTQSQYPNCDPSGSWNDKISSLYNDGAVSLFRDTNYSPWPGAYFGAGGFNLPGFGINDWATSINIW